MNFLIVANKAEKALYAEIIKSAPNATVLGAVSVVDKKFFDSIKEKWSPHAIIYDTSVPIKIKNTSHYETILNLHQMYPHIKIIVLAGEDDAKDYAANAIIKGSISNVKFLEIINNLKENAYAEDFEYSEKDELSASSSNNENELQEKLKEEFEKVNADFLRNTLNEQVSPADIKKTTQKKIRYVIPQRKFKGFRILYVILPVALVLIVTIVVALSVCVKTYSYVPSSADEITTYVSVETVTTAFQTEEIQTDTFAEENENEPTAEASTENVEASAEQKAYIEPDDSVSSVAANGVNSTSSKTDSTSKSSGSSSKANSNDSSSKTNSASSNSGNSSSSKTTNDNTATTIIQSSGGTPSVSYNNKNYSNSANGAVSSIKLSYSSKTLRVNDTLTLTAEISPASANSSNISWSSSNSNVVSVSSTGKMTAKKVGTAIITAKISNITAQCKVTVISN